MPDTQDQHPSPTEIHAARIRAASPRALREMDRKWKIVRVLIKGSAFFDPNATTASVAEEHGVSPSAVYAWLAKCKRGTRTAVDLLERPRGGKGKSRRILIPEQKEFATGVCLQFNATTGKPKPAIAAVGRIVAAESELKGWPIPSRYTLGRFLWSIPRTLRVYAAQKDEGLRKDFPKPQVYRAGRPNEAWVTDHKEMHIRVRCTDGGAPFRPDLTLILDRFDQCVLGFCLSRQANGMTFGRALRMALLPKAEDPEHDLQGRPDKMVTDKGQDFIGEYVRAILQKLGIEPHETIGRAPWSKGDIEGFFAVLDTMFVRFLEGHTGHRPTEKPVGQEPVYTIEELERLLRKFCFSVYNHLPFMNRRIHGQQFSRLQIRRSVPFPIHTLDPLDVDTLLLPRETRTLGKRGLTIDGIEYWNGESPDFFALAAERATVEVGVDYADRGEVLIFHRDRFVCKAFNWEVKKAGVTQADVKERLKLRGQYQKAVKALADPLLQASPFMAEYVEQLAAKNEREAVQIAAVAGRRPTIPILLPVEASARAAQTSRRAPGSLAARRRAPRTESFNDPYLTPIPGSEVSE